MVYVWIALGALVLVFLFFSFYAFKLGTGRRDRTELFRYSSVAPSARIPFRDRVEKGVNWFEPKGRYCGHARLSLLALPGICPDRQAFV